MCLKSDWCEGLDVTYDGASVSERPRVSLVADGLVRPPDLTVE